GFHPDPRIRVAERERRPPEEERLEEHGRGEAERGDRGDERLGRPHPSPILVRSFFIASYSRDFTTDGGTPTISAISSRVSSSAYRRRRTSRSGTESDATRRATRAASSRRASPLASPVCDWTSST